MNANEILNKKLEVSRILFTNDVPVNKAKIIGTFIEDLEIENTNLKQALDEIREFIDKFHILQRSTYENQHILQIIDKVLGDDEK